MKVVDAKLLQLLWNDVSSDMVHHFGNGTDKFVAPNKVVRKGVCEIEGNEEFEGLEYEATITLGKLIPKKRKVVA